MQSFGDNDRLIIYARVAGTTEWKYARCTGTMNPADAWGSVTKEEIVRKRVHEAQLNAWSLSRDGTSVAVRVVEMSPRCWGTFANAYELPGREFRVGESPFPHAGELVFFPFVARIRPGDKPALVDARANSRRILRLVSESTGTLGDTPMLKIQLEDRRGCWVGKTASCPEHRPFEWEFLCWPESYECEGLGFANGPKEVSGAEE